MPKEIWKELCFVWQIQNFFFSWITSRKKKISINRKVVLEFGSGHNLFPLLFAYKKMSLRFFLQKVKSLSSSALDHSNTWPQISQHLSSWTLLLSNIIGYWENTLPSGFPSSKLHKDCFKSKHRESQHKPLGFIFVKIKSVGISFYWNFKMKQYYFTYSIFDVSQPNFENVLCSFTNRIKKQYYVGRSLTMILSTWSEMII